MSHLDDEVIAAAALGEHLAAEHSAHLGECQRCAELVRETEALARRAGTVDRPKPLLVPPARVWDAIVAELAQDDPVEVPEQQIASVTPIRRRFSGWFVGAAATVGLIVGGIGVGLWISAQGDDVKVVASASLANLQTEAPAGTAHVEDRPDGTQVLVVDTDYETVPDGDLEVWLIDPNIEGMVSLGFLTAPHAEFAIPAGYDPAAYPIVDISVEPRDGVPTHSGDSIVRGTLAV